MFPRNSAVEVVGDKKNDPAKTLILTDLKGVRWYRSTFEMKSQNEASQFCQSLKLRLPTLGEVTSAKKELGEIAKTDERAWCSAWTSTLSPHNKDRSMIFTMEAGGSVTTANASLDNFGHVVCIAN